MISMEVSYFFRADCITRSWQPEFGNADLQD